MSVRYGALPMQELRASKGNLIRWMDFDLYSFARFVAETFTGLDRDWYARGWMPFPEDGLKELMYALGEYS